MSGIRLRGYAVTFGQSVLLAQTATYERFDPRAFDALLARPTARIDIRWREHDSEAPKLASTRDGTAGLFADDYGLGFWCRLENSSTNWGRVGSITARREPCDRCSIGGLSVVASTR